MRFKSLTLIAISVGLLLASCQRDSLKPGPDAQPIAGLIEKGDPIQPLEGRQPMSRADVDRYALRTLAEKEDFRWEWLDDYTFWSFVNAKEPIIAIGYKPAGYGDISDILHNIDLNAPEWASTREALKSFILNELNQNRAGEPLQWKDIVVEEDKYLPILTLRLDNYELIARLRRIEQVRYVEPLDYGLEEDANRSTSGCGGTAASSIPTADFTTTTPNAKIPWNFNTHNIPAAWSLSEGAGITIGVIDAGLSSAQPLLNADFASGLSTGRSISTGYTFGSSAFSSCSHGTSMSGLAAGPRNNNGATVGVAYKSDLVFYRACEDVVLDGSGERTGVKNALVAMGNSSSIRVISMSIGTPFYSSVLYDGVVYAHNRGKLIFAAAGTSFSWTTWYGVIYPANFSQCVAMTGIKENGSTCTVCHSGSQVDFTVVMERSTNSSRTSLSLHTSGYTPSYIGGSSTSTAVGAGIAALVWAARPTLSRDQVRSILTQTSQRYPNPSSSQGYGNLNAQAAVQMALNY